jgi:predicted acetyltransferase
VGDDRTVRTVSTDDELLAYCRGMMTAFLAKRNVDDNWVTWARERWDLDRTWAAFDGDSQCGTTRTFPSMLRLPGLAAVQVSCLTQVTVLPTHTRRGHLGRLMRAQLEAAIEAGEVASILVAAEWPIYGRFGYGPYGEWVEWEVDVAHAEVLGEPVGTVEIVEPAELDGPAQEVLARQQAVTPGCIERPVASHRQAVGLEIHPAEEPSKTRVRVLHRDPAGVADGYAVYDVKEHWDGMRPASTIRVEDLVFADQVAERELWRYLLDIDLVTKVSVNGHPDSVVRHVLANGRAARQVGRWDFVWARLLDVPACLEARAYAGTGRVVVEAVDPFLGRGGRFALDVSPEGASCRATGESAEVTLPVAALGAAWLGGTDLRTVAAAGTVDEHAPGALDRLAGLLRWHQTPWCHTEF